MTALIAVIGAVAPQLQKLFAVDNSKISAALVAFDGSTVTFLITNAGEKTGAVWGGRVWYEIDRYHDYDKDHLELMLSVKGPNGIAFIKPNSSEPVSMWLEPPAMGWVKQSLERLGGSCELGLTVTNADGTIERLIVMKSADPAPMVQGAGKRLPGKEAEAGSRSNVGARSGTDAGSKPSRFTCTTFGLNIIYSDDRQKELR